MMRFAEPGMFWLLLLTPLLFVLLRFGMHRKIGFLRCLGDLALLQHTPSRFPALHRPWLRLLLLLVPFLCIVLALADPHFSHGAPKLRTGVLDVVVLIDVSKSMLAEDYSRHSRLDKAREMIRSLLADLRGNRVGLVTFAGSSFRQAELTEDFLALDFIIQHWVKVDAAGIGGSDMVRALETGLTMFPKHSMRKKFMVLFSDGGNDVGAIQTVLIKAAQRGIRIVTLGLGTLQPSRIPQYDAHQRFSGYVQMDGQTVMTRLNETPLEQIAAATNGTYMRVATNAAWTNPLMQRAVVGEKNLVRNQKRVFQPFLLVGLLVYAVQALGSRL
jgi:Ca-activated chloride channel family protein